MRPRDALLLVTLLGCGASPARPPAPAVLDVALPAREVAPAPAPEPREEPPPEAPRDPPIASPIASPLAPPPIEYDHDSLRAGIRRAQPRLRACYEVALRSAPTLAGKIVLDLDVRDDGRVSVTVASTTLPPSASACVAAALRGVRLPPGHGGARVSVPLVFRR